MENPNQPSHDDHAEPDPCLNSNNNNTPGRIYLRIPKSLVCPFRAYNTSESTGDPYLPNDPAASGHLYLLSGELSAFSRYAGTTADWLIKVARLLCEPQRDGLLFTHPADTTRTAVNWHELNRTSAWSPVAPGDALRPAIYEFCPAGASVGLSQISQRSRHSLTASDRRDESRAFYDMLWRRDGGCVITGITVSSVASHLVPKRMGDSGTKEVVERFCGEAAADGIHRFHPSVGVTLCTSLDVLVDMYLVGFYHIQDDVYEVHNFHDVPDLTLLGYTPIPSISAPPLHRHTVTLTTPPAGAAALPPPGIFMWHYMQCVIIRFGTPEYKNLPDVQHYEYPFRTSDDSEEEWGDDEEIPPWPSYRMDMAVAKENERRRQLEQKQSIKDWAATVS